MSWSRLIVVVLMAALVGCSKGSNPTQPPPGESSVTILSHPASASIAVGGGPIRTYTPASIDTVAGSYSVRLVMLGYADTTFTVTVPASPDTIRATLRPLAGTPGTVNSWSVVGISIGVTADCLALDSNEHVYVVRGADGAHSVRVFTPDGVPIATWPFQRQTFNYTSAVIDPVGQLYISPRHSGLVDKFNAAGTVIGLFGGSAHFNTVLDGLALDPSGDSLFVATVGVIRILSTLNGFLVRDVLVEPTRHGVPATDGAFARDAAGYFYFAPSPGDSIYKMNSVGQRVTAWAMPGNVRAMAFASNGDFFATVAPADLSTSVGKAAGRIVRLTSAGTVLAQWGIPYMDPTSIAVAPDGDIYVSSLYVGVYRWAP